MEYETRIEKEKKKGGGQDYLFQYYTRLPENK